MSSIIDSITNDLAAMPGLGKRSAKRIVLHLLKNKESDLASIIEKLKQLEGQVQKCKVCGNIDQGEVCSICVSNRKDKSLVCVVAEVDDLWSLERMGIHQGLYHVLEGVIKDKTKAEDLRIGSLLERLKSGEVKEIIFANNTNIHGQGTVFYIMDRIDEMKLSGEIPQDLVISELAHGVPIGSELEYLDEGTVNAAFRMRRKV